MHLSLCEQMAEFVNLCPLRQDRKNEALITKRSMAFSNGHLTSVIKRRPCLLHEEPRRVPFLIILSDGCYAQFPVRILPPTSCMLAGVRLAVIGSDLHRGDETILNFATVC